MYTQEQIDSIFSDFKTLVLPQIRTAIEGRVKKVNGKGLSAEDFTTALKSALETLNTTTVPGIDTRLQAVEALMGEASQGDNDQVINKVREMISFFANIAESDTLAGLLASLKAEIEAEIPTVPTVKADGVTGPTINRFCECSTAAGTAAKTASMTAGTLTLEKGARVTVKFANENTADSPTLNIGGTGAKAIYIGGEQVTDGDEKELLKGTCDFVYNGTAWDMVAGAGGGGAGAVQGKIIVSLTALVNGVQGAASLLNGATVTLRNTTKDVQVGETQTWAGQQIVFRGLTPVENYRVIITNPNSALWAVSSLQQDVTTLGIGAEETVTFELSQDQYTMAVNIGGGRVVIGQTEYANGDTYGVAAGTSITATAKAVTNYVTPTPSISGKTITATYVAYGYVTVNTASNQGQDATIAAVTPTIKIGDAAAVNYTAPVQVAPDTQVIVTWPAVTGYATPAQQTFTKSGTSNETKTGTYQTTILTVVLTSDTGEAELSGVTKTVTDTTDSATVTPQQDGTYKIPTGHGYSVSVSDDVEGYKAPDASTGTAAGTTATVTMTYEEYTGFVDLGLPSGKKWATGNLVKDSQGNYSIGEETDFGTYISWGNIIGHNEGEGYSFDQTNYDSSPGKQVAANIPSNDADHDIALATLGSPWHLPTKEDYQELYNNTDSEWTTINGVNGYKFMKKTNHSVYVFLPASGYYLGASLQTRGTDGYYSSASFQSATNAYYLHFNSSSVNPLDSGFSRRPGFTVRPIQ